MNQSTIHPDLCKPIRALTCCCCGGVTQGRQFHNQDNGFGLGGCCVAYVKPRVEDLARTYGIDGVHYNLDPEVRVREPAGNGQWSTWRISQNLTCRWGEINAALPEEKPALAILAGNSVMLARLRAQMHGEMTFVTRKDGAFGLLFEAEYCSQESEKECCDNSTDWYRSLRPHAEMVDRLLKRLDALAPQFPGVSFAVPAESEVIDDRPAAWAFVPCSLLSQEQREALGSALMAL